MKWDEEDAVTMITHYSVQCMAGDMILGWEFRSEAFDREEKIEVQDMKSKPY
jgi:hypothetical protein